MLSIEIKVNGRPVAVIEAYNDTAGFGQISDYPYRGFQFSEDFGTDPAVFEGVVKGHDRRKGILELARRMLECICEE